MTEVVSEVQQDYEALLKHGSDTAMRLLLIATIRSVVELFDAGEEPEATSEAKEDDKV